MKRWLFLVWLVFCLSAFADQKPKVLVSYNALETIGFVVSSQLVKKKPIYLPFHFDAFMKHKTSILSLGLIYRFETYGDNGPLLSDQGRVRPTFIWTNHHEVFLLAGRRFNFGHQELDGFYASLRGGLGFAVSPKYFNFSVLAEPQIGYSMNFNTPGFSLNFGLGVLLNLPFYENIGFAVLWDKNYQQINALQIIVHQAVPIINVGLGFNL